MSGGTIDRRQFLELAGLAGFVVAVHPARWQAALGSAALRGHPGHFLGAHELETLRAVCDRLLPGPPEDRDPGAREAGCAEAIDLLLGAFGFDPPLVYAGGPWSDRHGGATDYMVHFIALDPLQELAWRIRIEGTRGLPERSFAGQVTGLQDLYRQGLADLDRKAAPEYQDFVSAAPEAQNSILSSEASGFANQVLSDALAAMYGPPEYGGNRGLVGWRAARWPGDVQPRGYDDRQVTKPDPRRRRQPYSAAKLRSLAQSYLVGIQLVD